jgi:Holliday junction resolvase-like predicted endonuclease
MTQRADETHESVAVRTLTRSDRGWLAKAVRATWGSIRVVSRDPDGYVVEAAWQTPQRI